jgi:hypothetical protein
MYTRAQISNSMGFSHAFPISAKCVFDAAPAVDVGVNVNTTDAKAWVCEHVPGFQR